MKKLVIKFNSLEERIDIIKTYEAAGHKVLSQYGTEFNPTFSLFGWNKMLKQFTVLQHSKRTITKYYQFLGLKNTPFLGVKTKRTRKALN